MTQRDPDLRGRVIFAIGEHTVSECNRCSPDEDIADAVLAMLPAPTAPASAPTVWIDGHPQLEAIAAAVWERCERGGNSTVFDDPRNIAVAALAAVLPAPDNRAAVLSDTDRQFLTYALDLAADQMASRGDEFGADDRAAMERLRRLAGEAQQDERCETGDMRTCTGACPVHGELPEQQAAHKAQQNPAQDDAAAHPPLHAWRVETRDPLANEWAPGSQFASRPQAVERYETATKHAPLWRDGTAVERRIVRETTTYTVEEPTVARSGQPDTDGEARL
jgi:hypothetical protein